MSRTVRIAICLQWLCLPWLLGCGAAPDDPATWEAPMSTVKKRMEVDTSTAGQAHVQEPRMRAEVVGEGPRLVLVGGGLTGWRSWEPYAERLAGSRTVARLQLLNVQYGLEDRPLPDLYTAKMESTALAGALDDLGWTEPVDLVAWSYGALVTLDFALDNPERVRTLTLIEPPAAWLLDDRGQADPDVQAQYELGRTISDDVTEADLERFVCTVGLCPPGTAPRELPQWPVWVEHRRSIRPLTAPLDHVDDPARLRDFDRPVLLVTGTGTAPFLRRIHDILADQLPCARAVEMPGGHAPQLVSFDRFLEEVVRFHSENGAPHKLMATSGDGTPIAYWRSGEGPPLLLVHGAIADHTTTWRAVLPELERRFTVHAMDRRGRGESGDAAEYELRREAEDVAAVVDAIADSAGIPVSVVGHSYGALSAIEAARLTANVHRLILYEGVRLRGEDAVEREVIDRLEALLEAGDTEGMLITMMRDAVEMPSEEIEMLRANREAWMVRLGNAPTIPRELREIERYTFEPERFRSMRTPTLLLVGEQSPHPEREDSGAVADALADARVVELPGQKHIAMYTAPELFVREVVRFLEEASDRADAK